MFWKYYNTNASFHLPFKKTSDLHIYTTISIRYCCKLDEIFCDLILEFKHQFASKSLSKIESVISTLCRYFLWVNYCSCFDLPSCTHLESWKTANPIVLFRQNVWQRKSDIFSDRYELNINTYCHTRIL